MAGLERDGVPTFRGRRMCGRFLTTIERGMVPAFPTAPNVGTDQVVTICSSVQVGWSEATRASQ